jgi:copper chaperone CopZ
MAFAISARVGVVSCEPCLEDRCVSEETDKDRAALGATMVAHIESDGVGSSTHEKAITDALNAIEGVQEVNIENGAIHVTYDPLRTTEKKIEESIRASGNRVTSATTASETPGPVTAPGLTATREPTAPSKI